MKRSTLAELVSPESLQPFTLDVAEERDGDVVRGTLSEGGATYKIDKGIPSFVSSDVSADQTVKSFSDKWHTHDYYRKHTEQFYTGWYLQRYSLGDADGLRAFLSDKKRILDAGTGAGRDAANFANHSSALVYAVDTAWHALENASKEAGRPDVQLVHADVNRLPFPDGFFDFVNCDQVIHHTPDPPTTFKNLMKKLRTGGEVTTYVYRKKSVIREFVDDYVRERIKDMPFDEVLKVMDGITKLGRSLAALKATVDVEEDIPVLGIKKGKMDVQRFFHWNVAKVFWNDDFDYFTNNVVNADWYHPLYCFRYEPDEFRAWFAPGAGTEKGLEILAWDEQEAGISCRARKL